MNPDINACNQSDEPLQAERFLDGYCYECPDVSFSPSNIYLALSCKDEVYLKVPTEYAVGYHENFLYKGTNLTPSGQRYWSQNRPIRYASGLEEGSKLDEALAALPDFASALTSYRAWGASLKPEQIRILVHYLIIHRQHYDRLKLMSSIHTPEARFVYFRKTIRTRRSLCPAIVQERIMGTRLWDMCSPFWGIRRKWREHIPWIASQLSPLLRSDDFDWNPMNFVYRKTDGRVYYVDSKPTTFAQYTMNEHNRYGIISVFLGSVANFGGAI